MITRLSISLLLCMLLSCSKKEAKKDTPFTVIFSCDTQGRLEPCGCFSGQFGGLSRAHTRIQSLNKGLVLRVDAGDAISGKEDYDLILYKYVQEAFKKMQYHALNIGAREASLSLTQLLSIKKSLTATTPPLISANLYDKSTNKPVFQQSIAVDAKGIQVLITGVVDPELLGEQAGEGLVIKNMRHPYLKFLKLMMLKMPTCIFFWLFALLKK